MNRAVGPFRPSPRLLRHSPWVTVLPCLAIAFLGLTSLTPVMVQLWKLWTTDALRSIGMFFPLISAFLTLRVWNRLGWEMRGTWWGLLPLMFAVIAAYVTDNAIVRFALGPHVHFSLLPRGLVLFAYASGLILLFGGVRVCRQAIFPLSMLLLVNPAPGVFNSFVDLPLQYISASSTRALALAIGVHPDGTQLRLMFAPEFGMFIAPGCNGIRGGLTMGYVALIVVYIKGFSIRLRIAAVIGGLVLGYLFNLIRLGVLVFYYWLALRVQALQPYAEVADYLIGATLFLVATALFVLLLRWKGARGAERRPKRIDATSLGTQNITHSSALRWKWLVSSSLIVLATSPYILAGRDRSTLTPASSVTFPSQLGGYHLRRTWQERNAEQDLIYSWGAYAKGDQQNEIEAGSSDVHFATWCHISRGEKVEWSRVSTLQTADGGTSTFQMMSYQDGSENLLEAATICTQRGCAETGYVMPFHAGLVFIGVGARDLIFQRSVKSRALLVRIQSTIVVSGSRGEPPKTLADLQEFISNLNPSAFSQIR